MANKFFVKGAERILNAGINFGADDLKVALLSTAYSPNLSTHEFLSDLGTTVLGSPVALTNKATTGGAFDADDVTFQAVATGATAKAVVIFRDTGAAGTSPLLAYIDDLVGFPIATNGSDITVRWDNGAQRIFSF